MNFSEAQKASKKTGIDSRLMERLNRWHSQLEKLANIESKFFSLEASEDSLLSSLTMQQEGKSMAEREMRARGTEEWQQFSQGLAAAKSEYNKERRLLEVIQKAYEAEYLSFKLENEAIKKIPMQGSG